jgi:hypothetical protein
MQNWQSPKGGDLGEEAYAEKAAGMPRNASSEYGRSK